MKNFIMKRSHLPYRSVDAAIDESIFDHLPVEERVQKLAARKAQDIAEQYPEAFVIGADTLTRNVATGEIYGKPKDTATQRRQALASSGQTIESVTGVSIWYKGKEIATELTMPRVMYQQFSGATYDRLAAHDDAPSRSSALGISTDVVGFTLVEHIEGSYTGIMGLPMEIINHYIDELHIRY